MLFKTLKIGCKQFESSLTCKSVDYSSKLSWNFRFRANRVTFANLVIDLSHINYDRKFYNLHKVDHERAADKRMLLKCNCNQSSKLSGHFPWLSVKANMTPVKGSQS